MGLMTQKALYRKAAIAALKNSQSVYQDARLLFEHDRSGWPAAALGNSRQMATVNCVDFIVCLLVCWVAIVSAQVPIPAQNRTPGKGRPVFGFVFYKEEANSSVSCSPHLVCV